MKKEQRRLRITQLDEQLAQHSLSKSQPPPNGGWLHAIRTAIGMSLKQLGGRLDISPQAVKQIEEREEQGSLSINVLKEAAAAMDLQLVYVLIPKAGSLDKMIEQRAFVLAKEVVQKTSQTMELEDQGLDNQALKAAIKQRAAEIKRDLPKQLWS